MEVVYSPKALKNLDHWRKSGNKTIYRKIAQLIDAIKENLFPGMGKPEVLIYRLSGKCSRRITQEHRIIYQISNENKIEVLSILSLRGYYEEK